MRIKGNLMKKKNNYPKKKLKMMKVNNKLSNYTKKQKL